MESAVLWAFEDASRTGGGCFLHGTHIPYRRSLFLVPSPLTEAFQSTSYFFWGGGVKIVYLHQLQFKLNNTNMRNNYITPTCEEIEINLDNTVLQSSILPSGFEDGGEIW